jgi:hypothetical protein
MKPYQEVNQQIYPLNNYISDSLTTSSYMDITLFDAPPSSLMDLTTSSKMKITKGGLGHAR